MIEDKELGLKVAENEEEALWTKIVKAREEAIKTYTDSIQVEEVFLKAAQAQLSEIQSKLKND